MKKNKLLNFLLILAIIMFVSCKSESQNNTVACTMEFRTVTINVQGDTLNHFYTIRVTSGDTIRLNSGNTFGANTYPVLDDSYQSNIANRTEQFRFVGLKNNAVLVDELFTIKADQCHISYVSGNQTVIF
jgi:hypothetical protein